jgi:hypothetical protein
MRIADGSLVDQDSRSVELSTPAHIDRTGT